MNYLPLFREEISRDTGIIVVIPAYDEPDLLETIDSLSSCKRPDCGVEVLVLINAPSNASEQQIENNGRAEKEIESWLKVNKPFFRLLVFNNGRSDNMRWGVGMARKRGMDEAAYRLYQAMNHRGVIASLDGDCIVAENYFVTIEKELLWQKNANAASLFFEHRDVSTVTDQGNAILLYELHLRYYFQALKYCGYPWVTHTVGSSMAVKADTYKKSGGMSPRQAGEDFYFIQKLIPVGGYLNIWNTVVYPSGRASNRVPFGTGRAVSLIMDSGDISLKTYNLQAFNDLKTLFRSVDRLKDHELSDEDVSELIPFSLRQFIAPEKWRMKIIEIEANTGSQDAFRKRFFQWFNMFMIVKYLNYVHVTMFQKVSVADAGKELLLLLGRDPGNNSYEMLLEFRELEKRYYHFLFLRLLTSFSFSGVIITKISSPGSFI